ncbi:MAG TPA: hypothetical protein VFX49_16385 [Chloroflexota bacterium]|nr:hypothetical protein [Chloroflexota bacterium]
MAGPLEQRALAALVDAVDGVARVVAGRISDAGDVGVGEGALGEDGRAEARV